MRPSCASGSSGWSRTRTCRATSCDRASRGEEGSLTVVVHRVLVADGERFFREAIGEALREAGIACAEVESAAEALRVAAREPRLAVALVDLALDGGDELVQQLR